MKSVKKTILAGVVVTSLLLTSLTGCGAASASGDAKETSQEASEDSSTSSENTFAFSEDCDMELTSTTIVGRVTGVTDNTISLDIADLSEIEFGGRGQRPEDSGMTPENGQAPEGDSGELPPDGEATPEKPEDEQQPGEPGTDDENVAAPDQKDQNRFQGGKDFSFDLDSLTYMPGTLTIEDESMLLTASERSLMSLFKGGDRMKGGMGDASSMPDLGSASDSSDSSSGSSEQDSNKSSSDNSGQDSDKKANSGDSSKEGMKDFSGGQTFEEDTEEPISLSDISEGNLVLITFDENGTITAIHVITIQ